MVLPACAAAGSLTDYMCFLYYTKISDNRFVLARGKFFLSNNLTTLTLVFCPIQITKFDVKLIPYVVRN